MRKVVQAVGSGDLQIVDVPRPAIEPTQVLVETRRSLISAGTERAVRHLAQAGMIAKARARPDLVRQVIRRARADGFAPTMRAVRNRLDEEMPLGYSATGVVVEVGGSAIGVSPGDRVATAGAGHAEYQAVSGQLVAPVPDDATDEEAAFATVASIALHGLRLAQIGPGSRVCVIGLGLVGQLAARLAIAAGCEVAGLDVDAWRVERARESGVLAMVEAAGESTAAILEWSHGRGVDAVVVTAATASSEPLRRAPSIARDRAEVVVVGDVGLNIDRSAFYDKELTLRVARSYGPGRYSQSYEDWGVDYPIGYVRWTAARNLECVLDMLASGRLSVKDLITHVFPLEEAVEAYEVIEGNRGPYLAVALTYPSSGGTAQERISIAPARQGDTDAIGLIGAGTFAQATLVPALRAAGFTRFVSVASASGLRARKLTKGNGFERLADDADGVINDPAVRLVVIATPHAMHADLVVRALSAGKHVFCEKPLALSEEELDRVERAWAASTGQLMVGFNRRFAPPIDKINEMLHKGRGPLVLNYRVNAGALDPTHWYRDRRQGGRLLGEACHFVDACAAVVGDAPLQVFATGTGPAEALLCEDFVLVLRYPNRSMATISYASGGHRALEKERLEILGRGHSVVLDDYRSLRIDGRRAWRHRTDKGHVHQLKVLRDAIASGTDRSELSRSAFATTRTMLAAVRSLLQGQAVHVSESVASEQSGVEHP